MKPLIQWVRLKLFLLFDVFVPRTKYILSFSKLCRRVHLSAHVSYFLGKEHALVISNHRSDIDWLVGWVLAQVHCLFIIIQSHA